ncbi:MAG: LptA/OstA family protein [Desulfovermiculus sp.]|nr:LptA/OstA family protein [Desulfovermiculus sp.]
MGKILPESGVGYIHTVIVICLLLWIFPIRAGWSQTSEMDTAKPMHIEADKVIYGQNERKLEFIGQVHVKRPDFELWCEKMIVTLNSEDLDQDAQEGSESGLGTAGSVRKILAQDNVRLVMDSREATSEQAEYYARESKLILQENVQLKENRNTVRGHQVTFYLDDGRSEIVGKEGSRVRAVFFPDQDEQDGK